MLDMPKSNFEKFNHDLQAYLTANSKLNTDTQLVNGEHCIDWQRGTLQGSGYGRARWLNERMTHCLAFIANCGVIPAEAPHILHACDRRICINPVHLRAGTHAENMFDMVKRGHPLKGRKQSIEFARIRLDARGNYRHSEETKQLISDVKNGFVMSHAEKRAQKLRENQ